MFSLFSASSWRSGTSLFLTLGLTASSAISALALPVSPNWQMSQLYSQQTSIPAGTLIPVTYNQAEKIVVAPDETMTLTLEVAEDIFSDQGVILVPAGSEVYGQLEPVSGGTQFVASTLILPNRLRIPMQATSEAIAKTESVDRGIRGTTVLQGAAVGAGAATLISAITGDRAIATEEVLGGAGLGALAGVLFGRRQAKVVVIDPQTDLNLTLNSDLAIR